MIFCTWWHFVYFQYSSSSLLVSSSYLTYYAQNLAFSPFFWSSISSKILEPSKLIYAPQIIPGCYTVRFHYPPVFIDQSPQYPNLILPFGISERRRIQTLHHKLTWLIYLLSQLDSARWLSHCSASVQVLYHWDSSWLDPHYPTFQRTWTASSNLLVWCLCRNLSLKFLSLFNLQVMGFQSWWFLS